ncbi:MAG: hypothetical protein EOP45_22365 [Sphingobacteriaceae bacterium]|nr:MAG: hypothetical protein EOP45_22365 [Sphingobacteriaceae bacterium]
MATNKVDRLISVQLNLGNINSSHQGVRTTLVVDCILKDKKSLNPSDQETSWPTIEPVHIDKISTGIKVMTFDFEVYSSVKGTFPDATRPLDCIFQVSMVFKTTHGKCKK